MVRSICTKEKNLLWLIGKDQSVNFDVIFCRVFRGVPRVDGFSFFRSGAAV